MYWYEYTALPAYKNQHGIYRIYRNSLGNFKAANYETGDTTYEYRHLESVLDYLVSNQCWGTGSPSGKPRLF